jgi:hypothetical protein
MREKATNKMFNRKKNVLREKIPFLSDRNKPA